MKLMLKSHGRLKICQPITAVNFLLWCEWYHFTLLTAYHLHISSLGVKLFSFFTGCVHFGHPVFHNQMWREELVNWVHFVKTQPTWQTRFVDIYFVVSRFTALADCVGTIQIIQCTADLTKPLSNVSSSVPKNNLSLLAYTDYTPCWNTCILSFKMLHCLYPNIPFSKLTLKEKLYRCQ
jgi:hypothetical protein